MIADRPSPISQSRDRPSETAHLQSDRDSKQPTPTHLLALMQGYQLRDHSLINATIIDRYAEGLGSIGGGFIERQKRLSLAILGDR